MKKTALIAAAFALTAVLASCSADGGKTETKAETEVKYERGTMDDGVYTSEWANLQIEIPDGLEIFSDEEISKIVGIGAYVLGEGDAEEYIDYAEQTTVYEFYAANYNDNEFLFMVTEKMPRDDFSENDYAMSVKAQLEAAESEFISSECADECVTENYGGAELEKYETKINVYGTEMYQTYLLRSIDGRITAICAGSATEEGIDKLLSGIQVLG